MKERLFSTENFRLGLRQFEDPTKAPIGSAQEMVNCRITDRGGISKRKGIELLGTFETSTSPTKGLHVFKKADGTEIPVKAFGTRLEYLHPTTLDWALLESGFTDESSFGFKESIINTESLDWLYFGNRFEDYSRWQGETTQADGVKAAGATTLTVDSVLRGEVYFSGTATANAATTIDVAGTPWAASQWIGFHVHITAGAENTQIRLISANTSSQITFAALGGAPGNVTFEIRFAKFSASGQIIVGGNKMTYSAIPTEATFTVTAGVAAADNDPVTEVITLFPENPRGNRLDSLFTRMYVGQVRSGLTRDAGGTLVGTSNEGSVYISKVQDPTDFTFAATRAAGEGAVVSTPYGGDYIADIRAQEDTVYIFKSTYIESLQFTQDANDLAAQKPISTGYGSVARTIKGRDDIFFLTLDNQFTSLGRVLARDTREQAVNIGLPVKRLLENHAIDIDSGGYEFQNRVYIPLKTEAASATTNRVLVYNLDGQFEGIWLINMNLGVTFNDEFYMGLSSSGNVVKALTGLNDVTDSIFPITSIWQSNWFNMTNSPFNRQEISSFGVEGYILEGTTLDFTLYKDLLGTGFFNFQFAGTESQVDSSITSNFLGSLPLGIEPLGAISVETDDEGLRHFFFIIYFPFDHANQISWGWTNTGIDQNYEIIRAGFNLTEDSIHDFGSQIKTI